MAADASKDSYVPLLVCTITVEFLSDFNVKKKDIEDVVASIETSTKTIIALTAQASAAFSVDDHTNISNQLQAEVKKASAQATRGKSLLDKWKADAEALRSTNPKSERLQAYKSQYMRLCKTYVDAVKAHQQAKEKMRETQTENLVRRGKLIYNDGTKTESEIRERVEQDPSGFLREAVMQQAAGAAQDAYIDAQSRARDVELLVRSINEVAAMFQDLAVLVQHQSEMLDTIESNVESAHEYIKKGNEHLRSAIKAQKRTRKCLCCMLCVGIIIVLLLVAGLGSFFGGAFKSA